MRSIYFVVETKFSSPLQSCLYATYGGVGAFPLDSTEIPDRHDVEQTFGSLHFMSPLKALIREPELLQFHELTVLDIRYGVPIRGEVL